MINLRRYHKSSDIIFWWSKSAIQCLIKEIKALFAGLGTAFFPVQNVPFFPVILKNIPFFPVLFFEFLATYETQKNGTFFPVLFKRTEKNVPFFCKERKRMQNVFLNIYIDIYIDIYRYIKIYIYRAHLCQHETKNRKHVKETVRRPRVRNSLFALYKKSDKSESLPLLFK